MRRLTHLAAGALALAAALGLCSAATADDDDRRKGRQRVFFAGIDGFQEVPSSISTPARGSFFAKLEGKRLHYALRLGGFETTILQAHLHFSREGTNGNIVAFLCASEPVPAPIPPGTPRCPDEAGGIVTGTIEPDDVGNPGSAQQGIAPGEFDELVKALRAEAIYVNVHSRQFVPGEIRGQVR